MVSWTLGEAGSSRPQARTDALLVEQVDAETVVYDTESKQVHCLGPLAAAVFAHCDGRTAPARLATLAGERLGTAVGEDEVAAALSQLEERRLLARPPLVLHDGLSRREMMRRSVLAGAAVAAVPLITSIAAPTAAMAVTGIPTGCTGCGKNSDCRSGHCCQNVAGKKCNQTCCVQDNNSCQLVDKNCKSNCACTVPLAGCDNVVCPPTTTKCCSAV